MNMLSYKNRALGAAGGLMLGPLVLIAGGASPNDPELTNWKGGIDVYWGGTPGVNYQEEYWYHDKLVNDTKAVWIRDDCPINMQHNERNIASTSGRTKTVVGSSGGGKIRYKLDGIWQELRWAPSWDGSGTMYPAYNGPFTLASTGVVGSTGWNGSHWRGMIDSAGDEWHVLMCADDDSALGGIDDAWASDGKYMLLCVNPKTPALTVRAQAGGQFYTTPAWTYWVPKIHDQTTYIQGDCSFELRNIYGGNISFAINGGPAISVGAPDAVLSQDDFNPGANTLVYWYDSTPGVKRTRKIVRNPSHPGLNESHGARTLGGDAGWTRFQSRAVREPYKAVMDRAQTADGSGQSNWDAKGRTGLRFGGENWPHRNSSAAKNAIVAKYLGFSSVRPGATGGKSYAAYAKEMLLEATPTQHPVGFEISFWASMPIPAADTIYRGYWDVNDVSSAATAYDVLMGGYRSDQIAGGITPVEDYYIRDMLASWCHLAALQLSGVASEYDTGMWTVCRAIGATMIACVMPNYSTSYYGTSGMNGNTTVYQWAPFRDANFTWKDYFFDDDHTVQGTNYVAPKFRMGLEGSVASGALIRPPGTESVWVDKAAYASWGQCSHNIANYALLIAEYGNLSEHPYLLNFIDQITSGTLLGGKSPKGPTRCHMVTLLNEQFPTAAANAGSWIRSLAGNDPNAEVNAVKDGGFTAFAFYDDKYSGGATTPTVPTPRITPGSSNGNVNGFNATIDCENAQATLRFTLDGSDPTTGSQEYVRGSTVIRIEETTTLKARAFLAGYNPSGVAAATYSFGMPQLATPLFENGTGAYVDEVTVSLAFDPNAQVRGFRVNGGSLQTYTGPFVVGTTGTTVEAFSSAAGYTDSAPASATFTIKAMAPSFDKAGGVYPGPVSWRVTPTAGAGTTWVTRDGSDPAEDNPAASTVLTGTSQDTETVRARTVGVPGKIDSDIVSQLYQIGGSAGSTTEWTNIALPEASSGRFRVSWKSVFSSDGGDPQVNCVTGLSNQPLTDPNVYGPLAVSTRAMTNGAVEARDGTLYKADNTLSYALDKEYLFEADIDLNGTDNRFKLTVTEVGSDPVVIAGDFAFRSGNGDIESLSNLAFKTTDSLDTHTVYDVTVGSYGGGDVDPPPGAPQNVGKKNTQ